jgi:uncharacterized protein (DUF2236 family)
LRRIDRRHVPVRGTAADGRAYAAHDPRLVVWVQATLVMTSLRLYELVLGRLSDAERESYWQEARIFAGELGATDDALPPTYADLERYERAMLVRDAVPDTTSVAVTSSVLHPLTWIPSFVYWPLDAFTAGLLPRSLRDAFGLRWRRRERFWFRFVIVGLRRLVPVAPRRIRFVPQARAYEARMR